MKSQDCMYAIPNELTGVGDCCGIVRGGWMPCNGYGSGCVAYRPHTEESRQALKEAIEQHKKSSGLR